MGRKKALYSWSSADGSSDSLSGDSCVDKIRSSNSAAGSELVSSYVDKRELGPNRQSVDSWVGLMLVEDLRVLGSAIAGSDAMVCPLRRLSILPALRSVSSQHAPLNKRLERAGTQPVCRSWQDAGCSSASVD
jgi:hypothetical protein